MNIWYNIKDKNPCLLVTDRKTRRYFSGIDVDEGIMLITDKKFYLTDARSFYAVDSMLRGKNVVAIKYDGLKTIENVLKSEKVKTLFIDFENTTVSEYQTYKSFKLKIKDFSSNIKSLKSIKN